MNIFLNKIDNFLLELFLNLICKLIQIFKKNALKNKMLRNLSTTTRSAIKIASTIDKH
jgi:hypothetical protein